MIENLPPWIDTLFILIVIVTIVLFYFSNGKPKLATLLIIAWSLIQSGLAYTNFYQVLDSTPPRFAFVMIPIGILFIFALLPKQINRMIEKRNSILSTFLHTIRIPMEIVLFYLFTYKMLPELMTFEGRNFDILVGLSAPIIGFMMIRQKISKQGLLIWNIIGLCFISFIFVNGLLSAELPFQQFGFDQPNRAVTFFPYILLPAVVVPIVMYTHITDIIKLIRE
jgi:hypothetical protein